MFGWFLNTPLALLMQHKYIISINPKRYEKIIRKFIMELWKNDIRHTFISFHGSYMEFPHPPLSGRWGNNFICLKYLPNSWGVSDFSRRETLTFNGLTFLLKYFFQNSIMTLKIY